VGWKELNEDSEDSYQIQEFLSTMFFVVLF
jgi:hypothetical protein